jgi:quercetin dioxygenase-like cupin family protein
MEAIWFIANLAEIVHSDARLDLVRMHAAPGDMPPLHVHADEDEGFYVLEGELSLWVGDAEPVVLAPGEFALAPRGVPHTYRVTGDATAVVLVTANGFAAFLRAAGVPAARRELPVLDGPPDAGRLARIAADHGITLLGPPGTLPSAAAAAAA